MKSTMQTEADIFKWESQQEGNLKDSLKKSLRENGGGGLEDENNISGKVSKSSLIP